jgi:hypothetical protein
MRQGRARGYQADCGGGRPDSWSGQGTVGVTDNEMRSNGPNLSSGLSTVDNDGAWLSYPELARLRGINLTSAFRLARRHGWRRQKGNAASYGCLSRQLTG